MTQTQSLISNLKEAYAAWNDTGGKSREIWMELLAENVNLRSLAEGKHGMEFTCCRKNKTEVSEYFDGLARDWDILKYEITEFIAQDQKIVAIGKVEICHRETKKTTTTDKVDIWEFENGKAIRFHEFYDTAAAMAAATP